MADFKIALLLILLGLRMVELVSTNLAFLACALMMIFVLFYVALTEPTDEKKTDSDAPQDGIELADSDNYCNEEDEYYQNEEGGYLDDYYEHPCGCEDCRANGDCGHR